MNWRLKELRLQKKLTQKKLADFLGVTHTTYNYYEKEKSEPTIETFAKLADMYGTTIDYLVGHETDLINLKGLDSVSANVIKQLMAMDDSQKAKVEAYIKGLLDQ